jgi:NAD(P)-dependent dehydrogenase (short-subunit alcohol dehydrogenase family)
MSEAVRTAFTPLIPLAGEDGRVGRSQDVAEAVRYFAGPESGFVTGQSFAVDGGQELRRNPDMIAMLERTYGAEAMAAVRKGKFPPGK